MSSTPVIIENSGKLEVARALQARLDAAKLHIVEDQNRFDALQSALAKDPGLVSEGVAGTTDPAIVAAEVASQIVRRPRSSHILGRQCALTQTRCTFAPASRSCAT